MSPLRIGTLGALSAFLVALGCRSSSLRAPVDDAHLPWLRDYQRARHLEASDPGTACALYTSLANESRFPPHPLARVRAWQVCPTGVMVNRAELPAWLKGLSLDVGLSVAVRDQDKASELGLSVEKSKQRLPQTEKLQWLQRSLSLARELERANDVTDIERRISTVAPRLIVDPRDDQYLSIAADLRLSRDFSKAREFYERVVMGRDFSLDDKITAYKGLRLSYKNQRQHDAHAGAALRLAKFLRRAEKLNPKSPSIRQAAFDAETYYARALWTLGQPAAAKQVFEALEKRMHGRLALGELYWLMGRLAEERADSDAVRAHFDSALKERNRDQELRDKILWYSAWNERRLKNHARAAEILTQLDEQTKVDFTRVRALFWLGKTLGDLNQADHAKEVFERLADLDAVGYYGLLARRHLGLPISFRRSVATDSGDIDLPLDSGLAEWLRVLDESEVLAVLLDTAAQAYRRQKDQKVEGWVQLFNQYAKAGLYDRMYEALGALPEDTRKKLIEGNPEFLFPRPFAEDVKLAALQFGVDEELIYAIMRQESAFNPAARSFADAFGLMQILPEVATQLGRQFKIPYAQTEDLLVPRVNISLGAAHLHDLLRRHKRQFILAVAAYNASESAIAGWMKTRYRGDALEFIEEIPYEETRGYVRLVMRNLIFYSLLKSKSASIEFPAWVLSLDAS